MQGFFFWPIKLALIKIIPHNTCPWVLLLGLSISGACLHYSSTLKRTARGILKNLIVRLQKDGKALREVSAPLEISETFAVEIRSYRTSHSTTNQSHCGCPLEMPQTVLHYLNSLALKTDGRVLQTWHRGYQWKSEFVRQLRHLRRTSHNVKLWKKGKKMTWLLFGTKLQAKTLLKNMTNGSDVYIRVDGTAWLGPPWWLHRGGGVMMIRPCRSADGFGELTFIDGTVNACG